MVEPGEPGVELSLSLPPKVQGRVSGYLVMKVDEILWARQQPGQVSAAVMWWGEDNPTTFRPVDVSHQDLIWKLNSVIYEIRTSKDLFEKYLKKCGFLKIAVADKYGMPIGCANVPDLHQMLKVTPFQNYFPIINNFGNRIGDIHVSFNLRMTSPAQTLSGIRDRIKPKKAAKHNSNCSIKPVKVFKTEVAQEHSKNTGVTACSEEPVSATSSAYQGEKPLYGSSVVRASNLNLDKNLSRAFMKSAPLKKSSSSTDNMISQILEHGKRIRNAMTHSFLECNLESLNETETLKTFDHALGNSIGLCSSDIMKCDSVGVQEYVNGLIKGKQEISTEKEKKILDFLSGKPLTQSEENEALEALRNTTPSKEILNKVNRVVQTSIKESECENMPRESSESSFDIDAALLSQVNSLRISIISLTISSVGLRRISSSSTNQKKKKKDSKGVQPTPPGVTYFVEYQIPTAAGSQASVSNVIRYCSKRQVGYEVYFGHRSVHNISALDRSSLLKHAALKSFISSLTFKVCARHLNQRVPVLLGLATPDSVMFLLGSAHLRHDYELQVVASDHLPVGKLKVCLELGRDRLHFGGLFDPENNSLGVASDNSSSDCKRSGNKLLSGSIKGTNYIRLKPSATVTRNVSELTNSEHSIWREKLLKGHSNRLPKHQKGRTLKITSSPESCTPAECVSENNQESLYGAGNLKIYPEKDCSKSMRNSLKHELAITVQQISGCLPLDGTVTDDRDCFVSYKFPSWDASVDSIVEWNSFFTEPSVCLQDTWFRPQCRVHSLILPDTLSLHVFLLEAFKMRSTSNDADSTVIFSICVRNYGAKVKDTLFAQAFLSYSSLVDLEDAYNSAAKGDPRFSDSSCASVALDLPLHFSPTFETFQSDIGLLKVKLDYRQVHGKLSTEYYDSASGISPYPGGGFLYPREKSASLNVLNTLDSVPSWAKSPPPEQRHHWARADPSVLDLLHVSSAHSSSCLDLSGSVAAAAERGRRLVARSCQTSPRQPLAATSARDCQPDSPHLTATSAQAYQLDSEHLATTSAQACQLDRQPPAATSAQACQRDSQHLAATSAEARQLDCQLPGATSAQACQLDSQHLAATSAQACQLDSQHLAATSAQACQLDSKHVSATSAQACQLDSQHLAQLDSQHLATTSAQSCLLDSEHVSATSAQACQLDSQPPAATSALACQLDSQPPAATSAQACQLDSHILAATSTEADASVFDATVGVECAYHLQSCVSDGKPSVVLVSCHPCEVSNEKEVVSPSEFGTPHLSPEVPCCSDPEWNWSCSIQLPADLLVSPVRRLVFKVWERNTEEECKASYLLGFAAVDLTVLLAGLPLVSGWFNIMDFAGKCRGQIKLLVEPRQDVSRFNDFRGGFNSGDARVDPLKLTSVYLAHCAYPEFPCHVAQHSDMHVQLVDSTAQLLERYRQLSEDLLAFSQPKPVTQRFDSDAVLLSATEEDDLTASLRKNMAELDSLTKTMKAYLMGNGSDAHEGVCTRNANSMKLKGARNVMVDDWAHYQSSSNYSKTESLRQCAHTNEEAAGGSSHHEAHTDSIKGQQYQFDPDAKFQKPRKTWEKHEELIDLRSVVLDCEHEHEQEPAEIEEVAEWLSNSAMHHIFNPVLFHDLLNELNPPASNAKVIELGDDSDSGSNETGDGTYRKGKKPVHPAAEASKTEAAQQRAGVFASSGGEMSSASSGISTWLSATPLGSPQRGIPIN